MNSSSPLYRSVNTRTRGVKHGSGGDFRHDRHTKEALRNDASRLPMHGRHRHGRDYTPLFRFLLSSIGKPWNLVFAEAKSRLDTTEPIFWLVARVASEVGDLVRVGESSYYSGMCVDSDGTLQLVNPKLRPEDMEPSCKCCTHTFNGIRFGTRPRTAQEPSAA